MHLPKQSNCHFNPRDYIGYEFSGVTLLEIIGHGAVGIVFIAFQKSLKRKVAAKIYPKVGSANGDAILQFHDEAETIAVLNHPNIAPIFDIGETEQFLYIIMQLVDGENLQSFIHRSALHPIPSRRNIPLKRALEIMVPIIKALECAHREQVVHQDVKPANILIEEKSGRPYLVDFGIARTVLSDNTVTNLVSGTPFYMAPEQACGHVTDGRADIYSAGVVLWEILAGKLPTKSQEVNDIMNIKIYTPELFFTSLPSHSSASIDCDFETILLKAVAGKPNDRYQSCSSFAKDLISYYEKKFKVTFHG